MKGTAALVLMGTVGALLGGAAEGQEATPRMQPGAAMTLYAPEQHDLYDGRFVLLRWPRTPGRTSPGTRPGGITWATTGQACTPSVARSR